jgi:perosamine synthetase
VTRISMSSPDLTRDEATAVHEVLTTAHLSIGPRVEQFEGGFRSYVRARHACAVSSGTAALHLAVIAAGVEDGNLVVTTPFSFVASANCALYERGVPIFVDVDPTTGNVDPALVAAAVRDLSGASGTSREQWLPRTVRPRSATAQQLKAVLPVHAFGQPADMEPINEVAREHGLFVIEDACEAIGSEYKGRRAGTLGDVGAFAFYPNKQMTTGEGGMLVTDSREADALFRSLRNQGRDVFDAWLTHRRLGYNYRLDELSAALGLAQLSRIEELLARRQQVAEWYNEQLADIEGIETPALSPTTTRMSWFVYVIRLEAGADRKAVMAALEERGVPSRPYFTPIHLQPFYVERFGYRRGDFPVAETLGERSLALPFSSVMTEAQVSDVCAQLAAVLQKQTV